MTVTNHHIYPKYSGHDVQLVIVKLCISSDISLYKPFGVLVYFVLILLFVIKHPLKREVICFGMSFPTDVAALVSPLNIFLISWQILTTYKSKAWGRFSSCLNLTFTRASSSKIRFLWKHPLVIASQPKSFNVVGCYFTHMFILLITRFWE